MKLILTLVLVGWAGEVLLAAPAEDLITNLPGLSWEINFKQYSGYLQGAGTKRLHYWFVESSSNPRLDPVVLWLNGGPGCSSLMGFLTEHGPFRLCGEKIKDAIHNPAYRVRNISCRRFGNKPFYVGFHTMVADDGVNLQANPYAWNQITNMIYLESPAGVGFSYSADQNYSTDDDDVARNNLLALEDFFRKFPEFKSNDFYITGESYGGIYVPTLASLVLDYSFINLKGFAVGNGLSDDNMNDNSIVYFAYYHGLIGTSNWLKLVTECCPGNGSKIWCDFVAGSSNPSCASELRQINNLVWSSGLNVYNLYSECAGGAQNLNLHFDAHKGKYVTSNFGWPFMFLGNSVAELKAKLRLIPADKLAATPPCTNDTTTLKYLNSPVTRQALHIPDDVQDWEVCSSAVGAQYVRTYTTMTEQYKKAINRNIRILVYNGDIDMACNFLGDEWFVDSLNVTNPQGRKAWFYNAADGTRQIAGYVKAFDRFTFVTIKGSGHMVPTDKPIPALDMYMNFIQDNPF